MVGKKQVSEEQRNRELTESIAKHLSDLAASVSALMKGPLKKRALVILLANSSGISQAQVSNVLDALANLERDWLNPRV